MATVQQWERQESIIWPPRGYLYTLGTFIFACILTGIFIYIGFQCGLSSLQRYYLPYYLRTEADGLTHPVSQYQLLYVSDGKKGGESSPEQRCTAGLNSPIRRQASASDAYSRAAKRGTSYLANRPPQLSLETPAAASRALFARCSTGSSRAAATRTCYYRGGTFQIRWCRESTHLRWIQPHSLSITIGRSPPMNEGRSGITMPAANGEDRRTKRATIEMVGKGEKKTSSSLVWQRNRGSAVVFGRTIIRSELHVVKTSGMRPPEEQPDVKGPISDIVLVFAELGASSRSDFIAMAAGKRSRFNPQEYRSASKQMG
jgi:hypothetical protein